MAEAKAQTFVIDGHLVCNTGRFIMQTLAEAGYEASPDTFVALVWVVLQQRIGAGADKEEAVAFVQKLAVIAGLLEVGDEVGRGEHRVARRH